MLDVQPVLIIVQRVVIRMRIKHLAIHARSEHRDIIRYIILTIINICPHFVNIVPNRIILIYPDSVMILLSDAICDNGIFRCKRDDIDMIFKVHHGTIRIIIQSGGQFSRQQIRMPIAVVAVNLHNKLLIYLIDNCFMSLLEGIVLNPRRIGKRF